MGVISKNNFLSVNQPAKFNEKEAVKRDQFTNIYVRNHDKDEFLVKATTVKDEGLDGNQKLTGTIEWDDDINALFLNDIDRFWEVRDHEQVWNKILLINKKGEGEKLRVEFTAVPLFFDYMDTNKIMLDDVFPYKYSGSMTAQNAMSKIFEHTPFNFIMTDSFKAYEWTDFGNDESRLEVFKKALNHYEMEFEIIGQTVYLKSQIGRDTSIMYRHKFNASNVFLEIDAQSEFTAIRGFGDFGANQGSDEEGEIEEETYLDARLIAKPYISPLAKVVGVRWAESIKDGRYKVMANLEAKMKSVIDESLKVSVTATIHNLSKQSYPIAQSKVGDRVFLSDYRIGYNEEIRITNQVITKDWLGRIVDADLTFGDENLGKKYQSSINNAVTDIDDLFTGKKELPKTFLHERMVEMSKIINGNNNSNFEYMSTGVVGYNQDDPNYMFRLVGDSLGFSDDAGHSYIQAISARLGINASAIMAGELRGIRIVQESPEGTLSLNDGEIESYRYGNLAMKWGGWEQAFYNPDGTLIGTLEPTRILNREFYGLSLTVTNDFLTIGHWIDGQRRPVFRTQELEGRKATYVLGPYDSRGSNNHTELVLGANSNIGLAKDGQYIRYQQPTLMLKNKPQEAKGNSAVLYFGGISRYADQEFEIRANVSSTQSTQVAVFRQNETRLNNDKTYFGSRSGHINDDDDGLTIFASEAGSGLKLWHGGQVDVMSHGTAIHKFLSNGNKIGGSIDIDGNKWGMSPVDSPQVLIEYIIFNEIASVTEKRIYLDEKYRKSVLNYAVFSSNKDVKIVEKQKDYFVIKGNGKTDLRIVGQRIKTENRFWYEMQDRFEEVE